MSEIYPEFEFGNFAPKYYVEFNRSGKNTFTLFRRSFIHTETQLTAIINEHKDKKPNDLSWLKIQNEGHPYQLFTADFGQDGCFPDKNWVKFMVDALNEKIENTRYNQGLNTAISLIKESNGTDLETIICGLENSKT